MERIVRLTERERKVVLGEYRRSGSRRAHVLLLLDAGRSYREVAEWLFASFDLIAGVVRRYREGGVDAVLGRSVDDDDSDEDVPQWLFRVSLWLESSTPRDFGYFRTRWSCDLLAEVLAWQTGTRLSGETIRRGLHRIGYRWRRPRPVVGPTDPEHDAKLRRIRSLLKKLPSDETAVFQDEVDVHLNPKIGSMWMPLGRQAEVVTPGNNVKRHLAGSLHWRTGRLIVSAPGAQRNAALFVDHLRHLIRSLGHYRRIHVVCDNAPFHDCRAVRRYLESTGGRIVLHFLPKYAPETNPIERTWWHLHETLTRNHRCRTIEELLAEVWAWIRNRNLPVETSLYPAQAA